LTDQITDAARARGQGEFTYEFNGSYQFEYASWPETAAHGRAVVEGVFVGRVTDHVAFLTIRGEIQFRFTDMFTDPTDIRDLLAAIREAPSATRELLNDLAELAGIGDDEAYQAIDVLPDDVPEWFLRLREVGGIAYPISGVWRSEFTAEVVKR
jgi:hypothetical protein